ncbi:MAG: efflux RND transporter permease subunit, partial [Rhodospirillales bacterium]
MSLSTPFILRPIGTSLLAAGLFLAGLVAYFALPVAPLPSTDLPVIFVSTSQPGADPVTMSQTVTSTLERHLGAIAGVNEMTSTSSLGRSNIVLQFDPSRRPADAARDVQAAINAAGVDLPAGLPGPPTWRKANPNDRPVLILALTSRTMTTQSIFDVADTVLAQRLSQIPGVAQANVQGAEKSAVRVQVDVSRLAAMRLSLEDVRIAIAAANVTQATGRIEGAATAVEIDTDTRLLTAADYADLRIRTATGGTVRLGDVATVFLGVENERQAAWYGAQRAVLVQILKQPGANVIETVDAIKAALPELSRWIPPAIDVAVINDQTGTIRASVEEVQLTLLISIALVVMVVALFLRRLATSFAAAVTVPLSLAGTFAVMWLLGYSLDNLTLMALTIAVGFVVDDAIVMIENVVRHAEAGKPPLLAAIDGAREIGFTVLSMTLSLVAVFIPLIFSGGVQGTFLRVFAITLTVAIVVSGLVSITLTPMVCARMLRPHPPPRRIDRWLDAIGDRVAAGYATSLGWAVRHRAVMLLGFVATVGATAWLYTAVPPGGFPTQDTGLVRGFARASTDTSFQAMAVRMQRAVDVVRADPAVAGVGGVTGGGYLSGNTWQMFGWMKPRCERGVGSEA